MGLLARLRDAFAVPEPTRSHPFEHFTFNGVQYPFIPGTSINSKQEEPSPTFDGYIQGAYKSNGVVFACMLARLSLFSEARFQFRQLRSGRPGELFGSEALRPLEVPWPNGTTGDLLSRAIQDADLAGNFYGVRRGQTIKRMRPDWVTIVLGSELEPEEAGAALDAEVIGYIYKPGGSRGTSEPVVLLPEEVCHFAPIPDPAARFRGMSWLTPVIREIMGDNAASDFKLTHFEKGATPNWAVMLDPQFTAAQVKTFADSFREKHASLADAYRTIFLGGGAKIEVIGSSLKELDFKVTQAAGETRICMAANVPPIIIGASEGLEAATYANYGLAMRRFADLTARPLWRNFAGSASSIIDVPAGSELWYDDRDIPALKDDVKDAAEVLVKQSQAIRNLTDGGYTPDSVVDAVTSGDLKRLDHTGLLSVQMQEPGAKASTNGAGELPIGAVNE